MYDKLTTNDIRRLEEEIEHRKLVVRKEAIEAVKEARAQGDLSENFEYYAAKRYKNQNESRIRYLEKMVKTAKIIEDDSSEDEVGLDNTVTVYFVEDDEEETYKDRDGRFGWRGRVFQVMDTRMSIETYRCKLIKDGCK